MSDTNSGGNSGASGSAPAQELRSVEMATWVDTPPVEEVPTDAFPGAVKVFLDAVKTMKKDKAALPKGNSTVPLRDQAEAASDIADESWGDKETQKFAYYYSGIPVSMMTIRDKPDSVKVEYLFSNPLTAGGGLTMIEYAACISEEKGKKGNLTLFAASEEAASAYRSWGFSYEDSEQEDGSGHMKLNPQASPNLWRQVEKRWFFVSRGTINQRWAAKPGK